MRLGDLADAVRQSVTAEQAARMLGLKPNRAGFCKCPFHGEKTGSMKLYPGDRGWYCFGCHSGGSVIDLVMRYYGMELKPAIEMLNSEFNLGLPVGYTPTRAQEEEAKRRAEEREAEQKRRDADEARRMAAFHRYLDIAVEISQAEDDMQAYAPTDPDGAFDPRWADAVNRLPVLRDEAEDMAVACFWK